MKVDKRRKVTPEVIKIMRELRNQSMTYQEISKKLNLSYLTVYKYLNVEKYPEVKLGPEMGAAVEDTAASKKKPGFWSRLKSKLKT